MVDDTGWGHILVVVEQENGMLSSPCREALGKGRDLADALGTYLWVYMEGEAPSGISLGGDRVFLNRKPGTSLAQRADALCAVVQSRHPEIVLAPHSHTSVSLMGILAHRCGTALVTDCVGLDIDPADRLLVAVKPLYNGKLLSEWIWPQSRPQIALVRPGTFPEPFEDSEREGVVEEV